MDIASATKFLGIHPQVMRNTVHRAGLKSRGVWTTPRLLAIVVNRVLIDLGVKGSDRRELFRYLFTQSDESLEAVLHDGRHFLIRFGRHCASRLCMWESVLTVDAECGELARRSGASLEAIDIKPLVEGIYDAQSSKGGMP